VNSAEDRDQAAIDRAELVDMLKTLNDVTRNHNEDSGDSPQGTND